MFCVDILQQSTTSDIWLLQEQEEAGPGVAKQQQPLYSGAKVTSAPEAAATTAEELGPAHAHGGSNEDMKKVLMELDNTGYFDEVGRI